MSFSASRNRRGRVGLTALAIAATAALSAAPASAAPAEGTAKIVLAKQQKGNGLVAQGVRISPLSLPVTNLELGQAPTARLDGSLKLSLGKRAAHLRELLVQPAGNRTAVSAKLGKQRLVVFRAKGQVQLGPTLLKLDDARLSLTGKAAKALKGKLGLDQLSAGKIGTLSVDAKLPPAPAPKTDSGDGGAKEKEEQPTPPELDPYFAQCGVKATSEATGSLPAAAALPTLSGAKEVVGAVETWGFKQSFRSYVVFAAGGSLKAMDGATTNGAPPVISSFDFPVTGGEYAANGQIDMTDDQAVVEGAGTALFCATGHGFRVAISNPTIVIDGADSRVVADVDTNLSGVWTPSQRIDLADLDLAGITPFYNVSGSEITWSDIPATLTDAGAKAICGSSGSSPCIYTEGTELDPVDVAVATPYDNSDLDALATYVEGNLPFPISDPTQGGCTLPIDSLTPPGYKTIDAVQALHATPATQPTWLDAASNPAPLPTLGSATALNGGGLDWGFRRSLRASINGSGQFNLAGGATASHEYFGNGGTGVKSMGDAGKFFTWPAQTSAAGSYAAGGPGNADDRLILRSQGRVAFCQTQAAQAYGTVFSNPTVVIDGANSRITLDVATRYRLSWVRGVVDFATLDLSDPSVTVSETDSSGTTTVEWVFPAASEAVTPNVGPVELTTDGEAVVNMLSRTGYIAGLGLDGVKVRASFPEGS